MNEVMAALRHPSTGHPAKFPYPPESHAKCLLIRRGPCRILSRGLGVAWQRLTAPQASPELKGPVPRIDPREHLMHR